MIKENFKFLLCFLILLALPIRLIALDDSDIFLDSVFISAVKKSNYDTVQRMIEDGISLNINDSEGLTPLAYALKNDDEKMFDILISKGADINKKILEGNVKIVNGMLKAAGLLTDQELGQIEVDATGINTANIDYIIE